MLLILSPYKICAPLRLESMAYLSTEATAS